MPIPEQEIPKYLYGLELNTLPGMMKLSDGREVFAPVGMVRYKEYMSSNFGEEFAIELVRLYGRMLSHIEITWEDDDTKEEVKEKIEEQIHQRLKNLIFRYDENMPKEFKEKYPDLFLAEDAPELLKKAYYTGQISLDMIKDNPEFAEFLRGKPLFGRIIDKRIKGGIEEYSSLYEGGDYLTASLFSSGRAHCQQIYKKHATEDERWLSDDEILDMALIYVDYLYLVESPNYDIGEYNSPIPHHDTWSMELKIKYIEMEIEAAILHHEVPCNKKVPQFFKDRHPDMFLAEDAPEELKYLYYGGKEAGFNINEIIKHPDWREYLKGKNLRYPLNQALMGRFFELFDNDTSLKLIYKYPETIKQMILRSRTNGARISGSAGADRIKLWYDATRRKIFTTSSCYD